MLRRERQSLCQARKVPSGERKRLRYALAADDAGARRLVVYDGGGLGANGRDPKRPHEYIVFQVLGAHGEHYDPEQNSVVAPIPPPVQRDSAVSDR